MWSLDLGVRQSQFSSDSPPRALLTEKKGTENTNHEYAFLYTDIHPTFQSVTSRLAVKVKYTPPGTINWGDKKSQKPRQELTISDLIPNEDDGEELHRRAVDYIMRNYLL